MANRVSYLIIAKDKFSATAARVSASSKKMAKDFANLNKKGGKLNKTFKNMGKITAGAALAGVGALTGVIRKGSKFETAMADMSAITFAAGEDLKFFNEESRRLAKETITSADKVAEGFKIVASAKSELLKDPKALSNVTEQVLLLKNAAGIDMVQAANVVTQSLNQFSAGADQANKFVNVLAAGAKVGASEVGETGVAIIKSGVAARRAGLTFEELNSSIQVLAKGGIKADIAGTGLQTVFLRLEAHTNNRFKPSIVGLNAALDNLAAANMNTAELTKLFGQEAIKQGATLIDNRALVAQWTNELTGTNVATQQAAIRMATFDKSMESIGITITDKLISAFVDLQPQIDQAVKGVTEFIGSVTSNDFRDFMDNVKILISGLMMVAKALGHVMRLLKVVGTAIGEHIARVVENPLNILPPVGVFNLVKSALGQDPSSELDERIADVVRGRSLGPMATAQQLNEMIQPGFDIGESILQEPGTMKGEFSLILKGDTSAVESAKAKAFTPLLKMGVNMDGSGG